MMIAHFASPYLRRRGVTLVELVVVVIILAVLGAVGVPRFVRVMHHQRMDTVARRVMEDIRLARVQAITKKASCQVVFEPALFRYRIPEMGDSNHPTQEYAVLFDASQSSVSLAAASFQGASTVLFSTVGTPQASGSVLLSNGVEEVLITVSPTGRVTRAFQQNGTGLPAGG
jgi:prepilin-type N-terminal cleavage/methylation domain-containing protein